MDQTSKNTASEAIAHNHSTMDDDVQPFVTCVMPTYNRIRQRPDGSTDASLLEEAMESFLRQRNYPNRELLIINDTPGQVIRIPRYCQQMVRVFNLDERMPSLGHKYRYAVERARGDYVTPWDDDDIMLPDRLIRTRQHLQGADTLIVLGLLSLHKNDSFEFMPACGFAADWYRTELLKEVGYHLSSFGSDAETRKSMRSKSTNCKTWQTNTQTSDYIYRWSTSPEPHLSGYGPAGYDILGKRPIFQVEHTLQPHWARDYEKLVQDFKDAAKRKINRVGDQR